jgi:hypothetical protein
VRLARVKAEVVRRLVEDAYRFSAPKRLVAALDQGKSG